MLPLITTVLPANGPAPQNISANTQSLTAMAMGDAAAAARQQLPVAVAASGAPAAYSPKTPDWRQTLVANRLTRSQSAATNMASDASAEEESPVPFSPAPPPPSQSIVLGIPRSTQFSAQFFAQIPSGPAASLPGFAAPAATQSRAVSSAGAEWRTAPIGKKPGVAQARGATAYGVAEARNQSLIEPATVDAVM